MKKQSVFALRAFLLCGACCATGLYASGAHAQAAAGSVLEEVVVTATKQSDSINRVPLSISAVTEAGLVQQGIKSAQDLSRIVPSLYISTPNSANGANVAIRGIASTVGAQTTGVYLDDTPIQRRNGLGGVVGNGTVFPEIFDLARVEVLRGPQGTLYGGSSEGGTIRFITPTPSLTKYSGQAKVEVASIQDGSPTYELGGAVGGPVIQDKLGFRLSAWGQHQGGYLDHVSRLTGRTLAKDTNYQDASAVRFVALWQPIDRLKISPAIYASQDRYNDTDQYWMNVPQFTVAAKTTGTYTHAAHTYGPYNQFGPYKTGDNCWIGDNYAGQAECARTPPRASTLLVPSLSVDYDLGPITAKSVTSYVGSSNKGWSDFTFNEINSMQGGPQFVFDLPLYQSTYYYTSRSRGISEELRFSSNNAPDARIRWVGGLFYSNATTSSYAVLVQPTLADLTRVLLNQTVAQRYGADLLPGGIGQIRDQVFTESETAGFGEITFNVTHKLSILAGARYSQTTIRYHQLNYGAQNGFLVPTLTNGGIADGSQSESPVTPKVGIEYRFSANNMVYFNASKGFRIGGVNLAPPTPRCASDLAALGIASTPLTYGSDSVWNYELGAKLRPVSNIQVNTSIYRIDWTNVQVNYTLPTCNHSYVVNNSAARSQGMDLQATGKFGGLSLTAQVGYTDAHYLSSLITKPPGNAVLIAAGDALPTPRWNYNIGGQYDFRAMGNRPAYVRVDYQYASAYPTTTGPTTTSYRPDQYIAPATNYVTARLGVSQGAFDVSLFANNLLNSQDPLSIVGGRSGCNNAACASPRTNIPVFFRTTFRPRTVGLTLVYRQ